MYAVRRVPDSSASSSLLAGISVPPLSMKTQFASSRSMMRSVRSKVGSAQKIGDASRLKRKCTSCSRAAASIVGRSFTMTIVCKPVGVS